MAAFTPIPRASVSATVTHNPGDLPSERNADFTSPNNPAAYLTAPLMRVDLFSCSMITFDLL
jgi:hypothetical protein